MIINWPLRLIDGAFLFAYLVQTCDCIRVFLVALRSYRSLRSQHLGLEISLCFHAYMMGIMVRRIFPIYFSINCVGYCGEALHSCYTSLSLTLRLIKNGLHILYPHTHVVWKICDRILLQSVLVCLSHRGLIASGFGKFDCWVVYVNVCAILRDIIHKHTVL